MIKSNIECQNNVYGRDFSYLRTGGIIKNLFFPRNLDELIDLLISLNRKEENFFLIGKTTNLMIKDNEIYKNIISTKFLNNYKISKDNIYIETGFSLPKFSHLMLQNGISGFELMEGIPGSIGGAIYMNAGTFNHSISDKLISVTFLDKDFNKITKQKEDLDFSFRRSIFQKKKDFIILSAIFRIEKGNKDKIFQKMKYYKNIRLKILEYSKPNLGSNFCTYDIYNEIANQNIIFKIFYKLFRFFKLYKFVSNKYLSIFTLILSGCYEKNLPYSPKTLNSFYKEKHHTSKDLIDYLNLIKKLTKNKLRQEIIILE